MPFRLAVAPGDRSLPPKLGHAIIAELARVKKWGPGWGYDRRKNLVRSCTVCHWHAAAYELSERRARAQLCSQHQSV